MTNPMINPQPNYSGVTIQIANPSVYASEPPKYGVNGYGKNNNINPYVTSPYQSNAIVNPYYQAEGYGLLPPQLVQTNEVPLPEQGNLQKLQPQKETQPVQTTYPPQYYLNNYNYQNNGIEGKDEILKAFQEANKNNQQPIDNEKLGSDKQALLDNNASDMPNGVKQYDVETEAEQDFSKSQAVIDDLDARALAEAETKKNTKQKKVVPLTNEYIKSLENYLNNPNDEIRLMASKEILTRLDEDKDRYDDAALNALLNKMLQDPSKLIRIAALSALSSQLASGNDYTVQLLHNIQQNPNADKEDVLQAADILLKMSAGTEIKDIPNPEVKENKNDKG